MSPKKAGQGASGESLSSTSDSLSPVGRVEIFASRGRPKITPEGLIYSSGGVPAYKACTIDFSSCDVFYSEDVRNVIVNTGKDKFINAIVSGAVNVICRMAIGDRGTLPSDPTTPKTVQATMTSLFNEVYRADIDLSVLDIGTPDKHQVTFIKTFAASDIPPTAFSNPGSPVVNEVGLITADLVGGEPLPRDPVSPPDTPDSDEALFAIRTYKSVPFEASNDISITVRYTIYVE